MESQNFGHWRSLDSYPNCLRELWRYSAPRWGPLEGFREEIQGSRLPAGPAELPEISGEAFRIAVGQSDYCEGAGNGGSEESGRSKNWRDT
jgi:hypothetical protein